METTTLKKTLALFEHLGQIKSRQMFGGFGVFCDNIIFALVVNDQLYLRASEDNETELKELHLPRYIQIRNGQVTQKKYFRIPEAWWSTPQRVESFGERALFSAKRESESRDTNSPERLRDLPNLRLSTEKRLVKAGIDSVDKLAEMGALAAFKAMQAQSKEPLNIALLWSLEGAIKRQHKAVIPKARREELRDQLIRAA